MLNSPRSRCAHPGFTMADSGPGPDTAVPARTTPPAWQGLTQAQWQTLWIAATGPLTVPQIARRLGVSRQNVQRVANDLAAAGMATFGQNPDHKSSPLLELTPAGRSALDRINTA